jgi:hypothetical protein
VCERSTLSLHPVAKNFNEQSGAHRFEIAAKIPFHFLRWTID